MAFSEALKNRDSLPPLGRGGGGVPPVTLSRFLGPESRPSHIHVVLMSVLIDACDYHSVRFEAVQVWWKADAVDGVVETNLDMI